MATVTPRQRISVRAATPADAEFIRRLVPRLVAIPLPAGRRRRDVLDAIRADIERALRDPTPGERCFVATSPRGARRGFLRLQLQRDFFSGHRTCHVSDIVVPQRHEGHGAGSAMLEFAHAWARDHGCQLLTLSVFPGNARARALYERDGFVPDLVRMVRRVQPPR